MSVLICLEIGVVVTILSLLAMRPLFTFLNTPQDMMKDGDIVSVKADNERGTIFNQVKIRVDDSFTLEMHIDTDEANAAKIATGNTVTIIK